MIQYLTIIFVLLIFKLSGSLSEKLLTEIVSTNKGPVRGEIVKTVQNLIDYSAFRAIPYAKPPIGELRFKPPVEADPWNEVLIVTNEANLCPQLNSTDKSFRGNEDCLYLNVFTPKIQFNPSDDELLAVMVWIYGGGFYERDINSSRYGPDFLVENNVIIVDMNYRAGALGFLSLNHRNATGNMGLKDQVLALKWVKKNIKNFGGDPMRITIFGQSAGGAAVMYHKISDASRGLFNASISMSGSVLNPWAISSTDEAVSRAFLVGKKLGITTTNKELLLEKLYNSTPEELVRASQISVGAISDYLFVAGIDKTQQLLADGSAPIYYYKNSFDYDMSYHKVENRSNLNGTAHSDDIYHIFWLENAHQSLDPSSDISKHRNKLVKLWTNFAKYFNPTPNGTLDSLWIPSGKEGMILEIGQTDTKMAPRPASSFVQILQKLTLNFEEKLNGCL
ncbi:hypothetical protein HCN44_001291 [Aphidius gifuensis]|uniref:Carboxylic ester hydrolase n=1 Tax=Aphidius gifuensis TaxID=684658 RepID=A0A834XLX4_APHGI|nr:hypothetical protein HCN44_001291 [Aphidius gifuensis]